MLFNSLEYMLFLPCVFVLYWLLPHRFRWLLLFVASYYFYMSWNARYVVLILMTTVISYAAALLIERFESERIRRMVLAGTMLVCFGVLFFYKYFGFVSESIVAFLSRFSIQLNPVTLNLLLPVGISFYTFQTLSYVIDVYRGDVKAEKNFGVYATFISFFPQLVAGPIERTSNLLPQIRKEHHFHAEKAIYGAKLMIWGFFKKLIIADLSAQYVDQVFANVGWFRGFDFVVAVCLFSVQIYCDFSGYSDIAIGTAKMLDIDLMTNFKSPYFAPSVKQFWARWHISLSTWFRDYVYIPLGGNRCSVLRRSLNLLITFLVSGLWHGANWTFVIWGGIHGLAQILENLLDKWLRPLRQNRFGRWIFTLGVFGFCCFSWVFFRAESLGDAVYILRHLTDGILSPHSYLICNIPFSPVRLGFILSSIVLLGIFDAFNYHGDAIDMLTKRGKLAQWIVYILLGLLIVFGSQKGVAAEFVYFQF